MTPILVQTIEQAQEVINRLKVANTFIYDVETDGLDWRTNRIVGHVATFGPAPQDTYYVPVRHGMDFKTGNILNHPDKLGHPFERDLNKITSTRRDLRTVGHHLMFDVMMANSHGITFIGDLEDTEVNDALLDEFARSHSLEASCQHAGTIAKKGEKVYEHLAGLFGGKAERRAQMGNFWKLAGNDPVGFDYAAGDGVSTWHLYQRQLEACVEQDIEGIRVLESRVTRTVSRMMRRGIRIDEARLAEVIYILETQLHAAKKLIPDGLNINSSPQLYQHFRSLGVRDEDFKRTEKGNPSFDESWLSKHPAGAAILTVRKVEHSLNAFAYPMRDRHLYNGRCYATFTQMANDEFGTVTGRFSSSEPNLQQVPKRNKEQAMLLRSFFLPDEGKDWVDADLSQCEPRLLAHYSQSRVLLSGYLARPAVDAHTSVATAANIDRESGKRLNQTLITGGGKAKIIAMLGARGAEIYDAYFEAMPEVRQLQRQANKRMTTRGYVISLLGRRARLESHDKGYLAINRLLQCGNADIIKKAMVDIDDYYEANGDVCAILNTVHDALGQQADMQNKKQRTQMMEALRLFTDFGPEGRSVYLSVPMMADYGIGKNWAEATFPKEKLVFGE